MQPIVSSNTKGGIFLSDVKNMCSRVIRGGVDLSFEMKDRLNKVGDYLIKNKKTVISCVGLWLVASLLACLFPGLPILSSLIFVSTAYAMVYFIAR